MPKYKITQGKLVTGRGPDRKSFGRGDTVELTVEQAKRHGMAALERVEAEAKEDTMELTTNPGQPTKGKVPASKGGK